MRGKPSGHGFMRNGILLGFEQFLITLTHRLARPLAVVCAVA